MHMECTCIARYYYKRKENKKKIYIIYFFTSFKRYIRELQTKIRVYMGKVEINVSEFYGVPAYYSVMPRPIFDSLESASLNGDTTAVVDKDLFDEMMLNFKNKMK